MILRIPSFVLFLLATSAFADSIAFVGGEVHPVGRAPIPNGTVIVEGERIVAVGADLALPEGARVIGCKGRWITPGLIAAPTQLGAVEISMSAGSNDSTYVSLEPVRAALRIKDAVDPRSTLFAITRQHGITSAVVAPSGGLVAGQSAWIDLIDSSTGPLPSASGPIAMHAALGDAGALAVVGTRAVAALRLRELLEDTRAYARDRAAYQKNAIRKFSATRLDLEAMELVIARKIPLAVHVSRASDIESVLEFGDAERIRLVLVGADEGWVVADAIARAGVPVVVNPLDNLPASIETRLSRADNVALLARAGVVVAISSGDSHNARVLRQLLGNAVRAGLPHEAALSAGTLGPASAFGLADRLGTLDRGKLANLVVWTGDPFEASSAAETVVIRGKVQPLGNRQTRLRDKYLRRLGLGGPRS
ncbi:MAG: amidohydrolase family protein [Deltaproteobacteria bacterium]|nr:amidohydrolase family protein [Deltaproteobacteria bacterium]